MQADGWTTLQDKLSAHGFKGSEFFTIAFLFLGHFIFTNLFIGVIIMVSYYNGKLYDYSDSERSTRQHYMQISVTISITSNL